MLADSSETRLPTKFPEEGKAETRLLPTNEPDPTAGEPSGQLKAFNPVN